MAGGPPPCDRAGNAVPPHAPVTFATPAAWRDWLHQHHAETGEIVVRCFRTSASDHGLTYAQALDEALCYGWIDGVRRRIDEVSFSVRFTPRRARSVWSRVNVDHVKRLTKEGRMTTAGLNAFAARDERRTGLYSFEQRPATLPPEFQARFRRDRRAWTFFQKQPPSYQRTSTHWVMSAKREETRDRRLATLIECSARQERIPLLARPSKPTP